MQCFDSTFRGFLASNFKNTPNIQGDLSHTLELADALKTATLGFVRWQKEHTTQKKQTLPGFDSIDESREMLLVFGTLFCDKDGAEIGSPYEAM
ncbi:hypothetical protein COOONC_24584 [Cooperia oncophora]